MFERFTDRARRAVVLAQEEARLLEHDHIGTEHVLLGLIHEGDGVAARALVALGVSLGDVRGRVVELVGHGDASPTGHIPFTPRAKKVLELSLREALELGHNYIGTEHILLGLIREGEGIAAQVLVELGADLGRVREQVLQMLAAMTGPEGGPGPAAGGPTGGRDEVLDDRLHAAEDVRGRTLDALVALWDGDLGGLCDQLGDLVRLASAAGDAALLARLGHIVVIDDAAMGAVHLKPRP